MDMKKEDIIKAIKYRIDKEYEKYHNSSLDFAEVAARKIFSTFDIKEKPLLPFELHKPPKE